jgi:hypothetical protein
MFMGLCCQTLATKPLLPNPWAYRVVPVEPEPRERTNLGLH